MVCLSYFWLCEVYVNAILGLFKAMLGYSSMILNFGKMNLTGFSRAFKWKGSGGSLFKVLGGRGGRRGVRVAAL